jgi:2-polyprenyl-3-methyl-5-hydroxy-6-metoxy-1,4-benzoquinol methylase
MKITNKSCPWCEGIKIHRYTQAGEAQILRCKSCGCAWTYPPPGDIDYSQSDFHQAATGNDILSDRNVHVLWREALVKQCHLILRHIQAGDQVLEIGCGQGLLLRLLVKHGINCRGLEPGKKAAEKACAAGLDVTNSYYTRDLGGESVKLVVLSQVFEHVREIDQLMEDIRFGCPNAAILFVQANYAGIIPRLVPLRWYAWLPQEHFWHFTPQSLAAYVHRFGFKVKEVEYSSLVHCTAVRRTLDLFARMLYSPMRDQFHLLVEPIK